ncbi:hypothetical protein ACPCSL_22070 [Streptomyces griseoincarnatus]
MNGASQQSTVTAVLGRRPGVLVVAAVERESERPLAEAVVRHAEATLRVTEHAEGFENVPGHGPIATVSGHRVVVGNRRLPNARTST